MAPRHRHHRHRLVDLLEDLTWRSLIGRPRGRDSERAMGAPGVSRRGHRKKTGAAKANLAKIKALAKKMGYRKVLVVSFGEGNKEHKL